jgi:hypothetical protein
MAQKISMMSFRLCLLPIILFLLLSIQSFAAGAEGIQETHGLPDLVITKIFFSPEKSTIKDKVILNVEFKNIGSGPAYISPGMTEWETVTAPSSTGTMGLRIQTMGPQADEVLGGKKEATKVIVLKPGESYASSMVVVDPGRLAPGEYTYVLRVNPDEEIKEADIGNNEQMAVLKMQGLGGR